MQSGGTGGFVSSISSSRVACSSSESVSFIVETMCWASTVRQKLPDSAAALDNSASAVQVLDDMGEAIHLLDQVDRDAVQREVVALHPLARGGFIPSDDGVERAIEPDEQGCELERLAACD